MDENDALIEEMMRNAGVADEPGEMNKAQVVHRGDDELEAPMVAMKPKSAGYTYIYDSRTGERSICNNNMLRQHLLKKRDDGSFVFTTKDPKIPLKRGTLKCLLHLDNPNRAHYDDLGLPTCRKANLTSPFQVTRHMQKRHKQEWATLEQERLAKKEQDDRDFQRAMMSGMRPQAEPTAEVEPTIGTLEAPLYVSDKPPKPRKRRAKLE